MSSWNGCTVANTYRNCDILIYILLVQGMQNVSTVQGIEE